ncbi:PREDICTED: uncharacterized protein LOC109211290 [Nicotiana attenuata]|uniref:uncharacterized protein LOC109211290 n=1 Tax=Nicotiana attenuata TaxID=49451 RepID=UPI000905CE5A|nr:PREDICTED: uncharacterized protein LOC109211290 [Nicotiana attenuata]
MVFYWPNMKKDISKWVSECDIFQRVKNENIQPPGLLQPLPIPELPWQDIAMDFIEGLPFSDSYGVLTPHYPYYCWTTTSRETIISTKSKGKFKASPSKNEVFADKHRTDRELQEGDLVYLKLQPYHQSSVAVRRNLKLSARHYGPYKIIQKVGSVANCLDLPPGSQIHLVFHVSQLKRRVGPDITPQQQPPACDSDRRILIQPEAILQ